MQNFSNPNVKEAVNVFVKLIKAILCTIALFGAIALCIAIVLGFFIITVKIGAIFGMPEDLSFLLGVLFLTAVFVNYKNM